MIKLTGDFGGIQYDSTRSTRYIDIQTETVLKFFKSISLQKTRLRENAAGLYTFVQTDGRGEARFASMRGPKHVLKKRQNGCVFNPKGKQVMFTEKITSQPIEYDNVICPDVFWNGCLEGLFGSGNQVKDLYSSPELQALLAESLEKQFDAIGNSYYDLAHFGNHPIIEESNINGWYQTNGTPTQEWDDFVDQQEAFSGIYTIMDGLKDAGREEYNLPIYLNEVDGKRFIGDPTELFERGMEKARTPMRQAAIKTTSMGIPLVFKCTRGIFDKYKKDLIAEYVNIPESFYLKVKGLNGQIFTIPDVLWYDGKLVMPDDEQELFDEVTGVITHRCTLLMPGVWGITYDVDPNQQFAGMGMQIVQKLDPEYKGKIFMTTTFRQGAGIVDPDFITMSSLVLVPGM